MVLADVLDDPSVPRAPRVGPPHPEVRLFLLSQPHQPDLDHVVSPRRYRPGIPPGIPGMRSLPPVRPFIILRAPSNCFRSWLTSVVVVPLPLAIRDLRLPEMIAGLRRSSEVMEQIMASVLTSSRS